MFGSHTIATINTLRSFSAAFRLPFVSTGLPIVDPRSRHRRRRHQHGHRGDALLVDGSRNYGEDGGDGDAEVLGYDLYLRPMYARAVVDLLKHYDCRQVWYLYNSNEGLLALRFKRALRGSIP